MELTEIVLQMENLGRNCEFGYVQAELGAKPVSLLRWAGGSIYGVIDGIEHGWDGLMDHADAKMTARSGDAFWWLTCRRYGIQFHTDIRGSQAATAAEAAAMVRKRLHWQAARLQDDLATGERLFVYSSADPADYTYGVVPLAAAMQDRGPAWLLFVTEGPEVGGRVAAEGLILGTLPRLTAAGAAASPDHANWQRLIPLAYELWRNHVRIEPLDVTPRSRAQ